MLIPVYRSYVRCIRLTRFPDVLPLVTIRSGLRTCLPCKLLSRTRGCRAHSRTRSADIFPAIWKNNISISQPEIFLCIPSTCCAIYSVFSANNKNGRVFLHLWFRHTPMTWSICQSTESRMMRRHLHQIGTGLNYANSHRVSIQQQLLSNGMCRICTKTWSISKTEWNSHSSTRLVLLNASITSVCPWTHTLRELGHKNGVLGSDLRSKFLCHSKWNQITTNFGKIIPNK